MSTVLATKEEIEAEGLEWKEPVKSDFSYVTGPGGKVYKVPVSEIEQYEVKQDPEDEHPALVDYDSLVNLVDWEKVKKTSEENVEAQHAVWLANGCFGFHTNFMFGSVMDNSGFWWTGWHRHPWANSAWVS